MRNWPYNLNTPHVSIIISFQKHEKQSKKNQNTVVKEEKKKSFPLESSCV